MTPQTFTQEITFMTKEFDEKKNDFVMNKVTKTATFREFSQFDENQHVLFFLSRPMLRTKESAYAQNEMVADPEVLKYLTTKAVDILLIENENFNRQDKIEFLADGIALVRFGETFLNKWLTFFLPLYMS